MRELWSACNATVAAVEQWLQVETGRPIRLSFKRDQQLQLLRLRTWSLRYYLPIATLLDMLVPILRSRVQNRKKKVYGLGVTPGLLVGAGAERILMEELQKTFDPHVLRSAYNTSEQERQLASEKKDECDGLAPRVIPCLRTIDCDSIADYVAMYTKQVMAHRVQGEVESRNRRKKKYRGNPWL